MDKKVENAVKNALTVVGALAVVKAAPVLAAGVAIGAVVTNPDKAKKVVEDLVGRAEETGRKWAEAARAAVNENDEDDTTFTAGAPDEDEPPVVVEVPVSDEGEPETGLFEEAEPVAPANNTNAQEKLDKFLNAIRELME